MDGRRLSFEEVGIYNGVFVMMDHQTRSFWSHFTGEGIRGPLQGRQLEWIQLERSTWGRVRTEHPDATTPQKNTLQFRAMPPVRDRQSTLGDTLPPKFVPTLPKALPKTLGHHEHGVGVAVGSVRRFYPLDRVYTSDLVEDVVGNVPVVVLIHDGSATAAVYSRCVAGRTLSFRRADGIVTDSETDTTWSPQGRGLTGPLKGTQLSSVRAIVTDWYGWAAYFPTTSVFNATTRTPTEE